MSPGVTPNSSGVGFWTRAPTMVAGISASSCGSGWLVKRGVGAGVGLGIGLGVGAAEMLPGAREVGVGLPGLGSAVEQAALPSTTSTR